VNNRSVGNEFENIACEYLISHGFEIIERNFHASRIGEIDIIAKKASELFFVEVKGRKTIAFGSPAEAVSQKKLSKIEIASQYFLNKHNYKEIRTNYIVIEILSINGATEINIIDELY